MARCTDCGFLALTLKETGELRETPEYWRRRGCFYHDKTCELFTGPVVCVAAKDKFAPVGPVAAETYRGMDEISRERTCDAFVPWVQGFSPKEHMEMRLSQQLLDSQAEHQRQCRREDRAWRIVELLIATAGVIVALMVGRWTVTQGQSTQQVAPPAARSAVAAPAPQAKTLPPH